MPIKTNAERHLRSRLAGVIQPEIERKIPDLRINDSGVVCWFDAGTIDQADDTDISRWYSVDEKMAICWQQGYNGRYYDSVLNNLPAVRWYDEGSHMGGPKSTDKSGVHAFVVSQRLSSGGDIWMRLLSNYDWRGTEDYLAPNWALLVPNAGGSGSYSKTLSIASAASGRNLSQIWVGWNKKINGNSFRGDMAEIIIYDRQLETAEVADVSAYLNTKYDL